MNTTHSIPASRSSFIAPCSTIALPPSAFDESFVRCIRQIDIKPDPVAHLVQSRDMLWVTDKPRRHRDQLVFPQPDGLATYNTRNGQYLDLNDGLQFKPSCITTGLGYIAAADLNGELRVMSVYDNRRKKRKILWTQQCPTSISLTNVCGENKLLASKEDEHISIFSMPTLASEASIQVDQPVSRVSISSDGTKMVVLCADHIARLYSFRSPRIAELVGRFEMPLGSVNTCVDWKDDTQFAIACDLGFTRVVDIRNIGKAVQDLTSKGHALSSPLSAIRSIKYSKAGSVDFLAFAEDTSFVNIVDARNYDKHQVVHLHQQGPDLPTTGLCFSSDGTHIYVGLARTCIADLPINLNIRRYFPAPPCTFF